MWTLLLPHELLFFTSAFTQPNFTHYISIFSPHRSLVVQLTSVWIEDVPAGAEPRQLAGHGEDAGDGRERDQAEDEHQAEARDANCELSLVMFVC